MRFLMAEREEGVLRFHELGQVRAGGVGATRELVCMYGPDAEYHAAPAGFPAAAVRAAAREANFPLMDSVAVRLRRGRDGMRGAVLTPAETLHEYARSRAEAAFVSPVTLVEGLVHAGCVPDSGAVLLVASTWATLVIYEGRAVADVRSDRIPADKDGRAGSLRALAALRGGAGSPGGVVVISAVAAEGAIFDRVVTSSARLRLDELLRSGRVGVRPDFLGSRARRRRTAVLALPAAALVGMVVLSMARAEADDAAAPTASVAPDGAHAAGEVRAGESDAAPGDPVGIPAASPDVAAPAEPAAAVAAGEVRAPAPTAAEVVPPHAAPAEPPPAPEPRFAFAGVGVSFDGNRVWYFVDGATRRVVAVGESGEVDE